MTLPSPSDSPVEAAVEGAVEGAAARRRRATLFLFAFLGWTFDFYDLVLLGFLKSAVGKELHLGPTGEAALLGVALGASGLGGVLAGALADRLGKRTLLAATVAVYSFGSLVCGVAPSLGWFLVGRAIVGLGVGGEWAIGHALLAEALPRERRGQGAALLQLGEPFGVALAAVAGWLVMPRVGWRVVLIGSAATAVLAAFARSSLTLPDTPTLRAPLLRTLARADVAGRFTRAWLLGVFKLGTYWTCYTWLPSFLLHQMGQTVGHSFAWMLTAQVGQAMGMVSFGYFADHLGRRPTFAAYSLLTAVGIGPLAFAFPFLRQNPTLFWTAMLLLGVGSGCTAGFGALLAELYPSEIRTTMMGATYNLARTAQLGAPLLVGWATARWGLPGGLGVPFLLALLTASWVWALPETRGIALPTLAKEPA